MTAHIRRKIDSAKDDRSMHAKDFQALLNFTKLRIPNCSWCPYRPLRLFHSISPFNPPPSPHPRTAQKVPLYLLPPLMLRFKQLPKTRRCLAIFEVFVCKQCSSAGVILHYSLNSCLLHTCGEPGSTNSTKVRPNVGEDICTCQEEHECVHINTANTVQLV